MYSLQFVVALLRVPMSSPNVTIHRKVVPSSIFSDGTLAAASAAAPSMGGRGLGEAAMDSHG